MSERRIRVGGAEWLLPADSVTDTVLETVQRALETGDVERLELVNGKTGGAVTVYLNGAHAQIVELDLGISARPSEISGGARRQLSVGTDAWDLPEGDLVELLKQVDQVLATGSVARLPLLKRTPGAGPARSVTVLLNGKAAPTVAVDLGGGPRPSEISGG